MNEISIRAIRRLISALADDREFLGYQLAEAQGFPGDYEPICDAYLDKVCELDHEEKVKEIESLHRVLPDFITPELMRLTYNLNSDALCDIITGE